jgi:hypothetical protein
VGLPPPHYREHIPRGSIGTMELLSLTATDIASHVTPSLVIELSASQTEKVYLEATLIIGRPWSHATFWWANDFARSDRLWACNLLHESVSMNDVRIQGDKSARRRQRGGGVSNRHPHKKSLRIATAGEQTSIYPFSS